MLPWYLRSQASPYHLTNHRHQLLSTQGFTGAVSKEARDSQAETLLGGNTDPSSCKGICQRKHTANYLASNPTSLKITVHLRAGLSFRSQSSFWRELGTE